MAERIEEEGTRFSDPNSFESQVREYVKLRDSIKFMKERQEELHGKIMSHLDSDGDEDGSGNISLFLDSPVGEIQRIQKTRRVKRVLDEAVADKIIEDANIGSEVYEMKRVIDESALMSAFYEEKITEDQLDAMFPSKVTWALDLKK